jgi:hypothetical protein
MIKHKFWNPYSSKDECQYYVDPPTQCKRPLSEHSEYDFSKVRADNAQDVADYIPEELCVKKDS